ncbi:transcriptional regulator, AraC family [Paenibacillus curdlanolyticus YK9]|uniref:Transcriptional regulator, AraC family n=1 Tax=Paenibacillus curdlanolyticus YK9 TaxID=717606 RepID=E0I7H1_9BACL|nr:AraC family transcriptional regulator [Paenibacillus curdlanolyticus]EFM11987.1 transcriptional regulator, AraC family [Paenibacillus curdlanolyticus YK9]
MVILLDCKIISSFTQILLVPEGTLSFEQTHADSLFLMKCRDDLRITTNTLSTPVKGGSLFIGSNFHVENVSAGINLLSGIEFSVSGASASTSIVALTDKECALGHEILNLPLESLLHADEKELLLSELILGASDRLPFIGQRVRKIAQLERIGSRLIIINRYLRNHYYRPITLDDLASLIGCNSVYLSNTYSKVFNISPIQYLQKIRMQKAREFIHDHSLSISDISRKVGYVSSSQFCTIYKKHFGMTPSENRKFALLDK